MYRLIDLRYPGVIAVIMATCAAAHAQSVQTGEQDRVRLTPSAPFQNAYAIGENGVDTSDHAAQSPNDTDLGEQEILKRVEQYQPFSAGLAMLEPGATRSTSEVLHEADEALYLAKQLGRNRVEHGALHPA